MKKGRAFIFLGLFIFVVVAFSSSINFVSAGDCSCHDVPDQYDCDYISSMDNGNGECITTHYMGRFDYGVCNSGGAISWLDEFCTPSSPTVNIAANPEYVPNNLAITAGPSKISWSSTDATSCSIAKGLDPSWKVTLSGTDVQSGALPSSTKFTATCTGPGGSTSASVDVHVKLNVAPCIFGLDSHSCFVDYSWDILPEVDGTYVYVYDGDFYGASGDINGDNQIQGAAAKGSWHTELLFDAGIDSPDLTNIGKIKVFNNQNLVDKKIISATCVTGTRWKVVTNSGGAIVSGSCVSAGTLSATDCIVKSGESTCNSTVVWEAINPEQTVYLSAITIGDNLPPFLYSGINSGIANATIKYPSRSFLLREGSGSTAVIYAETTAIASCEVGTVWDTDIQACVTPTLCGDGTIDFRQGEECDGSNLGSQTCTTMGYTSGTLSCDSSCQFNATLCTGFTPTCTDTDSPTVNYTSQGTVNANSGTSGTDFCFNSGNWGIPTYSGDYLTEYYCSSNSGVSAFYQCPAGCTNGACNEVIPTYCGDGIVQSPNGAGFSEQCDGTSGCNASCQFAPELYWAETDVPTVSVLTKSYANPSINLAAVILSYSGDDSFHIYQRAYLLESDFLAADKDLGIYSGAVSNVNGDGSGDEYYIFTINQTMLTSKNSDGDYEFYFEINGLTSPTLIVSENLGLCGDRICQVGEDSTTCPADCPIDQPSACVQLEINLCSDYVRSTNPEGDCNLDLCDVAKQTPPPAGIGQTDKCQWDSSNVQCNKANLVTSSNGASIGSCTSKEDPRNDDCSDGFLSYSWSSNWAWATSNNFTSEASCELYSSPDCSGKCSGSGTIWHCDPYDSEISCKGGSSVIPCPAQVQLGFFDWRNVIAVVIIIFVLYILLMKKKKVPKNSSPKVKSKKK